MSIQRYLEEFQQQVLPNWSSDKSPYFKAREDGMGLMTYGDIEEDPRNWDHLRRCTLAAPTGYAPNRDEAKRPLTNWANHFYTPEQWERAKAQHDQERYALRLTLPARSNMKTRFKKYLIEDDETAVINPIPLMDLFANKKHTADYLDETGMPGIPSMTGVDVVDSCYEEIVDELGDGGEYGFVVKPFNGFGGDGVEDFESLDEVEQYLEGLGTEEHEGEEIELIEKQMVQPKIPHESDLRVITVGDDIVNAERRIAENGGFKTNISSIDGYVGGKDLGVYGKAYKALKKHRVQPISVDVHDNVPQRLADRHPDMLSSGIQELAYDLLESFTPEKFGYDGDLLQKPIVMGADMLETSMDDIQHLPEEYRERAENYADGDTVYLIPELNGNPGSMADLVARWTGMEEQISTLHLVDLMDDIVGGEGIDFREHVGNEKSELWRRVDNYYPKHPESAQQFHDVVHGNLKLENRTGK
jgi:glutathione synthase/RimK-type ligase-like ATP-grasp enzyme